MKLEFQDHLIEPIWEYLHSRYELKICKSITHACLRILNDKFPQEVNFRKSLFGTYTMKADRVLNEQFTFAEKITVMKFMPDGRVMMD